MLATGRRAWNTRLGSITIRQCIKSWAGTVLRTSGLTKLRMASATYHPLVTPPLYVMMLIFVLLQGWFFAWYRYTLTQILSKIETGTFEKIEIFFVFYTALRFLIGWKENAIFINCLEPCLFFWLCILSLFYHNSCHLKAVIMIFWHIKKLFWVILPLKNVKKPNFIFDFLKCARFNLVQILCQSLSLSYLTPCKKSALQEDFDENMFFLQHCA